METKKVVKTGKEGGFAAPDFEIEDQFKLPYGLGFDHVIKKKADMVNSQKVWNNKIMDELIEKLGYMDYRDALACNKYILEAKKHKDYHQMTRAKVLTFAMNKYNQMRKDELDNRAASIATTQLEKDEAKLRLVLDEDPEMA